jgi:hypothetical protein
MRGETSRDDRWLRSVSHGLKSMSVPSGPFFVSSGMITNARRIDGQAMILSW